MRTLFFTLLSDIESNIIVVTVAIEKIFSIFVGPDTFSVAIILPAVPVSFMCKVSATTYSPSADDFPRPMTSRSADDIKILSPVGLITLCGHYFTGCAVSR